MRETSSYGIVATAVLASSLLMGEARADLVCDHGPTLPVSIAAPGTYFFQAAYADAFQTTSTPSYGWSIKFFPDVSGALGMGSGGGGALAPFVSDGTSILVLDAGTTIGSSSTYGDQFGGGDSTYWSASNVGKYLGFRVRNQQSLVMYGWMQLDTTAPQGFPATINHYCYQDSGASVVAGELPTAPNAPVIGTVIPGDGSAVVTFTPPSNNGNSRITSYVVTSQPGNITSSGCTASPCTVTGLTNGTSYTFTVTATNWAGTSPASAASTPVVPMTPTLWDGSRTALGTDLVCNNGPTLPFSVVGQGVYITFGTPDRFDTSNYGTDTIRLFANGNGTLDMWGPGSSIPAPFVSNGASILVLAPGTMIGPSSTFGDQFSGGSTTMWRATNTGRYLGFRWGSRYGWIQLDTTAPQGFPATINSYCYQNDGSPIPAGATPMTPAAPTIGTATAGDGSATVTFTAPTAVGGRPITGYVVTSQPGNFTSSGCTASPCTVTGLGSAGTSYTFTVAAVNAIGTGPSSSPSNSVTIGMAPAVDAGMTDAGTTDAGMTDAGDPPATGSVSQGGCRVGGSGSDAASAVSMIVAGLALRRRRSNRDRRRS